MEKKGVIGIGILLVVLVLIGGSIYYIYTKNKEKITNDTDTTNNINNKTDYKDFDFEYSYKGENTWEYTVTGTLPTPCYEITTEAIVMESSPEQVIVRSTVTPPSADTICIQVIQEVLEVGEFEASKEAQVSFEIE